MDIATRIEDRNYRANLARTMTQLLSLDDIDEEPTIVAIAVFIREQCAGCRRIMLQEDLETGCCSRCGHIQHWVWN